MLGIAIKLLIMGSPARVASPSEPNYWQTRDCRQSWGGSWHFLGRNRRPSSRDDRRHLGLV